MNINIILLIVSLIVIFGYIAEWVFRKTNIPDILFLIVLGFLIGPNVSGIISPESLDQLAPLFTAFTLLFLMFEGALSIDLKSLAAGIGSGISIGLFNFLLSALLISGIFYFLLANVATALMLGFSLGGITSAFVIPLLQQLKVEKKMYSVLTLESALTDVLAIVLGVTMMEIKTLNVINIRNVLAQISSMFAVAGIVGIAGGSLWIFLEYTGKLIERDKNYLLTIAYLMVVYFITEYLGGNGAIAALFFGIALANSDILIFMGRRIHKGKKKIIEESRQSKTRDERVVSNQERRFFHEISFFLKTFFFVYIGLLLNLKNLKVIAVGSAIAVTLMLSRTLTGLLTRSYKKPDRLLINTLFARGIAPVAIILIALERQLIDQQWIVDTVYFVITATIVLSSLRVFFYRLRLKALNREA
jgi:cell volume regulation protein A